MCKFEGLNGRTERCTIYYDKFIPEQCIVCFRKGRRLVFSTCIPVCTDRTKIHGCEDLIEKLYRLNIPTVASIDALCNISPGDMGSKYFIEILEVYSCDYNVKMLFLFRMMKLFNPGAGAK